MLYRMLAGATVFLIATALPAQQTTRWTGEVSAENPWPEYPRPQMVREQWLNLNGQWELAITSQQAARPDRFEDQALVPYPVESLLSGVQRRVEPDERLWYRRRFTVPEAWSQRVLLHFGAVDWEATVWVNDSDVGTHRGGYDAFTMEITDQVRRGEENEIVVAVWDPSDDGGQPAGKQRLENGGIFYTPSSGIWQTVWLEPVPDSYLRRFFLTPDIDGERLRIEAEVNGPGEALTLRATATGSGRPMVSANAPAGQGLDLAIPEPALWWPDEPFLYDLELSLIDASGERIDTVQSYFGMREIRVGPDEAGITRLLLNDRFVFQLGPLDQGFWPDGLHTAPTDSALRYDLEVMKEIGFNMVRKHVKVEPARWYSWCDRMGLLVWQDMPSARNRDEQEREQFELELQRVVEQFRNHPSIIGWVPFNEGWGQYDTPRIVEQIREWDPTRLVNNASGWTDRGVGDVFDQHAYPGPAAPEPTTVRAAVLGEFGGLGLNVPGHMWTEEGWGYQLLTDPDQLAATYEDLYRRLLPLVNDPGVSAAVYTQISDIETENNGLMTYDREILKIDAAALAMAHAGRFSPNRRGVADIFIGEAAFELVSPASGAVVHYTTDGSEPNRESAPYQDPIRLGQDTEIRAITVWPDGQASRTRTFQMKRVEPMTADRRGGTQQGIQILQFQGRWQELPDLTDAEANLAITGNDFSLDRIQSERDFALRFRGWLTVERTGVYTFYLSSDDGSRLRIGDRTLLDNDGVHGMRESGGSIALSAGTHRITLDYFQGRGGRGLSLEYQGPDLERQSIPRTALSSGGR